MKGLLSYLTTLFSPLVLALEWKFPALSSRRGLSNLLYAIIIAAIIIVGVVIVLVILFVPVSSTTSTTIVYP